jgi:copper chaperone CopZ|tara:strand:- start:16074 stop:16277 length:204 start_codon:yes stop_codon:yes gene_type:complete
MKKLTLHIKGMTCKSCEILIKDELEEHKGVQNIVVSQPEGKVILEFDSTIISEESIKEIIKKEGFVV